MGASDRQTKTLFRSLSTGTFKCIIKISLSFSDFVQKNYDIENFLSEINYFATLDPHKGSLVWLDDKLHANSSPCVTS